MTTTSEDVAAGIREWLRQNVVGSRQVSDTYPLIDEGVLTSLQTIELVLFLEERFRISIDEEEVSEENFESISAIAELVASKKV